MKKLILSALGALLLVAANPALSQEKDKAAKETTASTALQLTQCAFKVSGMTCGGCAGMVEQGLRKVEGVQDAKVDWKSGDVKVKYDEKTTTPKKIVAAFNKQNPGFRAELPKPKGK
jgi:copper chaperone CopZ